MSNLGFWMLVGIFVLAITAGFALFFYIVKEIINEYYRVTNGPSSEARRPSKAQRR
ncbi:MAG: hypothetical protein ACK57J_19710 [Rubrivivax sp.]|jgi:hypothetical protein